MKGMTKVKLVIALLADCSFAALCGAQGQARSRT